MAARPFLFVSGAKGRKIGNTHATLDLCDTQMFELGTTAATCHRNLQFKVAAENIMFREGTPPLKTSSSHVSRFATTNNCDRCYIF